MLNSRKTGSGVDVLESGEDIGIKEKVWNGEDAPLHRNVEILSLYGRYIGMI